MQLATITLKKVLILLKKNIVFIIVLYSLKFFVYFRNNSQKLIVFKYLYVYSSRIICLFILYFIVNNLVVNIKIKSTIDS